MEQLLQHIPYPYNLGPYGQHVLENQISQSILLWSHVFTAVVGILFALFIYRQTKKLSSLYLLFLMITFSIWAYLDLVSWSGNATSLMYTWSIMSIFNVLFISFTYWFLYAFITEKDLPLWQKTITMLPLGPTVYFTIFNLNIHTYYNPEGIALEEPLPLFFGSSFESIMVFVLLSFTIISYAKAQSVQDKKRVLLGGFGTILFMAIFSFTFLITTFMIANNIGTTSEAYNISVYALFGMPFLVAFLGYLIAKYQAFYLKLTKSIGLIVLLMSILFISVFI